MKQIINKSNKLFINRFIAGTLLLGSSPIITTKIQATPTLPAQTLADQTLPLQEKNIPTNNRDGLLEIRRELFKPKIVDKDGTKTLCKKIIKEKGINLNMPICAMTLLEEAILRRLEDAAEILIELSDEMNILLGRKNALDQKNASLLHIATHTPKTMKKVLNLRENFEMVRNDTEIFELYAQTREALRANHHPKHSYASKKIIEALLTAGLSSKIDEPEGEKHSKTTPFSKVKQFLENTEYLKKHPIFWAEYKEIMKSFRRYD